MCTSFLTSIVLMREMADLSLSVRVNNEAIQQNRLASVPSFLCFEIKKRKKRPTKKC